MHDCVMVIFNFYVHVDHNNDKTWNYTRKYSFHQNVTNRMYQNLALQPVAISNNLLEVKTYIIKLVRDICNVDKEFIIKI